ncbi:MAG: hypothetical protein HY785_05165 [Oscillatoriophycideae cyanobacterium NC_groundwater_1537_Pr4_S-0.65um_50_18]|nr:hypothetical protein [Oscillatoriophycideae cyanobacterium NC_groundwater_1537_Pr4_S-0.65um_50_18]
MKTALKLSCLGAALTGLLLLDAAPIFAQEIQLGDSVRFDLDNDNSELRPRVSTDGDRVNLEVYEQPEPETRIRLSDEQIDIRQVEPPPEERLDLSIPLN